MSQCQMQSTELTFFEQTARKDGPKIPEQHQDSLDKETPETRGSRVRQENAKVPTYLSLQISCDYTQLNTFNALRTVLLFCFVFRTFIL